VATRRELPQAGVKAKSSRQSIPKLLKLGPGEAVPSTNAISKAAKPTNRKDTAAPAPIKTMRPKPKKTLPKASNTVRSASSRTAFAKAKTTSVQRTPKKKTNKSKSSVLQPIREKSKVVKRVPLPAVAEEEEQEEFGDWKMCHCGWRSGDHTVQCERCEAWVHNVCAG
jgi:type IV secretory pathway VirJ component